MAGPSKIRRESASVAFADAPVPPHSVEAEQAVLGGLLLDPVAWDNVADICQPDDFYRPDHKLIFEAIGKLAGEGKPCDAVTVSQYLDSINSLEAAGGLAYLGSVVRDTPTAANVRAYAEIVRERSLLRQLIRAGSQIASSVFNNDGQTARDLVDKAEQMVFEIAEGGARGNKGAIAVRTMLPKVIDQIDEWHANPDGIRGLPTGFTDFDKMTGGLRPGDLVIVAGRPSMGKTTLAVNMAEYAAVHYAKHRASVAIFSMEMPSEQLITRMLSSIGGVPLGSLRSGRIGDDDWVRITSATSQLSEAKIFIDETPALTPTELRARSRRVKREHGLDLVVVDYLQLMQVPGTKENRATEIAEISRGLKVLAKELSVPVIALSQLNRAVEQRENKKPVMSDLRECVTAETLVCLTDGRRVPISDLVGTQPEVWALDDRQRLAAARSDKVWKVGRRPVFKVQLASGRAIRATSEHRLLAGAGWTTVGNLACGDRLALSRRLPEPVAPKSWPDQWLLLLGQVMCDNGDQPVPAGVGKWLKDLGIFGQRSHEKRLPREVFELSNAQVRLLLRHLWATDGSVTLRSTKRGASARVYFATCGEHLARDVAALLLRLEIVARIRVVHSSKGRPVYTVDVSGAEAQLRFARTVGGFGPREAAVAELVRRLSDVEPNTNVDTLPVEACAEVRAAMQARGVTTRAMAAMRGTACGGTAHFKFSPSRSTLADYARQLAAPDLARWTESEVFWDRITGITPDGEEDVFDLTVPGPANWLADGIATHNSGAIEQDADMILLIYREEVYDRNTTKKGIAEIDLVKHRNGEIGNFVLTFQGQFTRFANYAPDSYADGVLR